MISVECPPIVDGRLPLCRARGVLFGTTKRQKFKFKFSGMNAEKAVALISRNPSSLNKSRTADTSICSGSPEAFASS
jgi:hypothetical protein